MLFIFTIIIILLWKEWKCNRKDDHTHNRCYDNQWKSCFYKIHKAITADSHNHSICGHSDSGLQKHRNLRSRMHNTALGSAPILCAIDKQIGTSNAVVAVFDIKLVITQHSKIQPVSKDMVMDPRQARQLLFLRSSLPLRSSEVPLQEIRYPQTGKLFSDQWI